VLTEYQAPVVTSGTGRDVSYLA